MLARLLVRRRPAGHVRTGEHAGMPLAGGVHPRRGHELLHRLSHESRAPTLDRSVDPPLPGQRRGGVQQPPVGRRQRGVGQPATDHRYASVRQILGRRGRPLLREQPLDAADRAGDLRQHGVPMLGVVDGEPEDLVQADRAVVAEQCQPGHRRTRNRSGEGTRPRYLVQPEFGECSDGRACGGGALAAQHRRRPAGQREQQAHVSARPVQVRLDDLQGEAGGDGRIDGVPAGLQHRHSRRRREVVSGGDHSEGPLQFRAGGERRHRSFVCLGPSCGRAGEAGRPGG